MSFAERYKDQAKDKGRFEEMAEYFRGAETKDELSRRGVLYTLSPKYDRSDICLALKAVEMERGWHA